jgi:hypothetical protein
LKYELSMLLSLSVVPYVCLYSFDVSARFVLCLQSATLSLYCNKKLLILCY